MLIPIVRSTGAIPPPARSWVDQGLLGGEKDVVNLDFRRRRRHTCLRFGRSALSASNSSPKGPPVLPSLWIRSVADQDYR